MNTYAEASLSNSTGEVILRGDASEVRAEILAGRYSIPGGYLRFNGFCGDDLMDGTADIIDYDGKWVVNMYHTVDGKRVFTTDSFESLSVAMRVAHGWCIAD